MGAAASGFLDRYFKITARGSTIGTELRAGCVTFVTLAYIIAVNSSMIAETGGTCKGTDLQPGSECVLQVKEDLVTATAVSSLIATLLMGLWANLPLGLAPGMGMNAYFTYTVVGFMGSGKLSYESALTCIFIEGIVFIILALTGIRLYIAKAIPQSIKFGTTVGIGLFLALLGFMPAEGIALVVTDPVTSVTLGGCGHPDVWPGQELGDSWRCYSPFDGWNPQESGFYCGCEAPASTGGQYIMQGATTWMGLAGFWVICVLMTRGFRGAIFAGMIVVSILSWIPGTSFTYFPETPSGEARWDSFKQIVGFNTIKKTGLAVFPGDFGDAGEFAIQLIMFLYVDILDTTGTLYSMTDFAGMLKEDGDFEGSTAAFASDAIGTVVGSLLGTSPVTTYIESGAGIQEGGRTGLTAVVVAFWFFISLFFFPIFISFPPWATGPALIIVGGLMMKGVSKINFSDFEEALPAAVTIMLMPFTFSIANGIIFGWATWIVMKLFGYLFDLMGMPKVENAVEGIPSKQVAVEPSEQEVAAGEVSANSPKDLDASKNVELTTGMV